MSRFGGFLTANRYVRNRFPLIVPSLAGVVRQIPNDGTMNIQAPTIINAAQAAERLSLSISTLAKMRLSGSGPAYAKLGRRVVYRIEDLDAWVEGNRYKSTAEYTRPQG